MKCIFIGIFVLHLL